MDEIDKQLLEEVQRRFPLVPRPYLVLGQRLGLPENEVMDRLENLKQSGILRQIGAIFNPPALGYRTTLVAAAVPEEKIDRAAQVINAYPGVSHNYLRDHRFNLWFTIACPPGKDLEKQVAELMLEAQAEEFLLLPIKKVFRIAVVLELSENGDENPAEIPKNFSPASQIPDERTISLVRTTQEDLPRVKEPFALWGEKIHLSATELLAWIEQGLKEGLIRRFAGLVKHTRAGFKGNVMVAWQVPEDRLEEIGLALAQEKAITHCYERKSYPHWPYNLYTMLHADHKETASQIIRSLAERFRLSHYLPLVTLKELKKTRLKLFWPENERKTS